MLSETILTLNTVFSPRSMFGKQLNTVTPVRHNNPNRSPQKTPYIDHRTPHSPYRKCEDRRTCGFMQNAHAHADVCTTDTPHPTCLLLYHVIRRSRVGIKTVDIARGLWSSQTRPVPPLPRRVANVRPSPSSTRSPLGVSTPLACSPE